MLINCPACSARVEAIHLETHEHLSREEDGTVSGGEKITLLKCPACDGAIVSKQDLKYWSEDGYGELDHVEWSDAKRVWPVPETSSGSAIPRGVLVSLDEAQGCLSSGFYTSSVVMGGRALELSLAISMYPVRIAIA